MPDMEDIKIKKMVEKKKHPQIVNVLKELLGATTIVKLILDFEVYLTIKKLFALVPMV